MKNLITICIAVIGFQLAAYSQSPLDPGQIQANFGIGIDDQSGLPIYGGLDFGIADDWTAGAVLSFASSDYVSLGANINYHFDDLLGLPPEWNVYGGANAGILFEDDDIDDSGNGNNQFGIGIQAGGRYFFNDRWGINLQVGTGKEVSDGRLGLTVVIN